MHHSFHQSLLHSISLSASFTYLYSYSTVHLLSLCFILHTHLLPPFPCFLPHLFFPPSSPICPFPLFSLYTHPSNRGESLSSVRADSILWGSAAPGSTRRARGTPTPTPAAAPSTTTTHTHHALPRPLPPLPPPLLPLPTLMLTTTPSVE